MHCSFLNSRVKHKFPNNSEVQFLNYFTHMNRGQIQLIIFVIISGSTVRSTLFYHPVIIVSVIAWALQRFYENSNLTVQRSMFAAALFSLSVVRRVVSSRFVFRVKPPSHLSECLFSCNSIFSCSKGSVGLFF